MLRPLGQPGSPTALLTREDEGHMAGEDEVSTAVAQLPANIHNNMLPPMLCRGPVGQQQQQQGEGQQHGSGSSTAAAVIFA